MFVYTVYVCIAFHTYVWMWVLSENKSVHMLVYTRVCVYECVEWSYCVSYVYVLYGHYKTISSHCQCFGCAQLQPVKIPTKFDWSGINFLYIQLLLIDNFWASYYGTQADMSVLIDLFMNRVERCIGILTRFASARLGLSIQRWWGLHSKPSATTLCPTSSRSPYFHPQVSQTVYTLHLHSSLLIRLYSPSVLFSSLSLTSPFQSFSLLSLHQFALNFPRLE